MKNIIITGATGYIGSRLVKKLNHLQYNVFPLLSAEDKVIETNYYNIDELSKQDFSEETVLVNLAFPRKSDPELLFNIFDFTYDIYSKCQQWGVKKIINISSQSVYDRKRMTPAKETDLVKPFSLYGLGKKYVEDWTSEFSQKNGLKYINLRLGSVIGPEFHARILNRLCKQAMETHDLQIKESEIQFSFIYIEDVIDSLIASLEIADQDWNEIYNVGAATAVTLTEVAQEIARQLSEEVKIDIEVKPAVKTTNQVDISKFQKATNWVPAYDLEKIIEGILDFYGK